MLYVAKLLGRIEMETEKKEKHEWCKKGPKLKQCNNLHVKENRTGTGHKVWGNKKFERVEKNHCLTS